MRDGIRKVLLIPRNITSLQMNETYQHPGKWHEFHIKPIPIRIDNTHFIMSYVIKNLEHNAVYEAIVQAKNRYGWNEVSL